MKFLILTFALACFSTITFAEPGTQVYKAGTELPWYQIELLVFESNEAATNEKWPVVLEEPETTEITRLAPASRKKTTTLKAFQKLRPEEQELTPYIKSLQHNNARNVLLHVAWRQPLQENSAGTPVHLFSISKPAETQQPQTAIGLGTDDSASVVTESAPISNFVDGTVTLILTRYLHLKTHMVYFNPDIDLARQVAEQDNQSPILDRFVLKESRRVKRQELHYLDHPYFGIIAKVTRFEPGKKSN